MAIHTAYITGAGDFCKSGFHSKAGDLVIAADGGHEALFKTGVRPHLVLGDMDSISSHPTGVALLRFPREKDETDIALGLRLARGRGYRRFKLYGALGGRMDHSLANLQLLAGLARAGLTGRIIAPGLVVYSIHNGALALPAIGKGGLVSVFAFGGAAEGVSLQGLKYPLVNAHLDAFEPLGISNEALGLPIKISVQAGTLLAFVRPGGQE